MNLHELGWNPFFFTDRSFMIRSSDTMCSERTRNSTKGSPNEVLVPQGSHPTPQYVIRQTGGVVGIRDIGLLQSALTQPKAKVFGRALYRTLIEKAAALCYFLVQNPPFFDGNKRVGHIAMETLLVLNGHELSCSVDEQEKVIGDLAAGQLSREDFSVWVESKTQKLSK